MLVAILRNENLLISLTNSAMRIRKVAVIGAGVMGHGIAALCASAGLPVVLLDIPGSDDPKSPDRSAPARN